LKREAGIHADAVHNKIIRNYTCGLNKHFWLNADNLVFAVTTNTECSQRLFFLIIIMNTKLWTLCIHWSTATRFGRLFRSSGMTENNTNRNADWSGDLPFTIPDDPRFKTLMSSESKKETQIYFNFLSKRPGKRIPSMFPNGPL
jgi:hypothetical protein